MIHNNSGFLDSSFLLITILLLLFSFISENVSGDTLELNTYQKQRITGGWQYHWGDLPKNSKTGQWIDHKQEWTEIESPNEMQKPEGENIVWLKINLPNGNLRDPYLFINSVDLTLQVFQNNQEIYHFGEIDEQGNSQFIGWPWHMIRLPDNYAQHTLYFRIFSDYPYIGLSGEVVIGNHFQLLDDVYKRGITGLFVVLIVLLVGIISTTMGTIKKDRIIAISTGLLSFDLALMIFSENELNQVVLFEPLLWRYIAAFSYFLIPSFLSIILLAWLKEKAPKIIYWVLGISLSFFCIVAGLSSFTAFNFINAYPYFDVLFIILLLALMARCYKQLQKLELVGSVLMFGILTLFVSLMLDMLSAHNLISWLGHTSQWGLIFFVLASLVIYLVRDWQQQAALQAFTHHLELKVSERTAELQKSHHQLEQMAREDYLTKLLNRRSFSELALVELANAIRYKHPISLILFDLDHFKNINDQYGHSSGDLVLKAVASLVKQTCRKGELICRYGGEEFVILLHETDSKYAKQLAQRLCTTIKEIEIITNNHTINITASFGLICLTDMDVYTGTVDQLMEQLLAKADKIMYEVKSSGRDAVKINELKAGKLSSD